MKSIFLKEVLDIILPRICPSCQKKLSVEENCVCRMCLSSFPRTTDLILEREFERKFSADRYITSFYSLFLFERNSPVQNLLHSIKYHNRFRIAYYLGVLMAEDMREKQIIPTADIVIPVPLHPIKRSERGYNQSFYICKGISDTLHFKLAADVLKRTKYTLTQTHLSIPERKANVRDAFRIKKRERVEGKTIILVDDVITTGATINACAGILKESGCADICAVSAALAL